ncbi:MAG: CocE/NonD family hydrolase [Chloroflexota bacterium]
MRKFFYWLTAIFGGIVSLIWILRRRILGGLLGLPPVKNSVTVNRNLAITMRDGVTLMTDHYAPDTEGDFPTILIRSVYGRGYDAMPGGMGVIVFCERLAERGYHVVAQTTRGQFDSGGDFMPYIHEKEDGLDTIAWIQEQDWYNGTLGMFGMSYLGLVQWAIAGDAPDDLKAIVPTITSSHLRGLQYPDDAFALELSLRWVVTVAGTASGVVDSPPSRLETLQNTSNADVLVESAYDTLPLTDTDKKAIGQHAKFYQQWLATEGNPDDPYWQAADFRDQVARTKAKVHLIGGWYDIFLRDFLEDYQILVENGNPPYLTIGPWTHLSLEPLTNGLRESVAWFDAQLKGDTNAIRQYPVRIYVMGAEQWRNLPSYPPPSAATHYYLTADKGISQTPPADADATSAYTYRPANPTPAIGGVLFNNTAGRIDNAPLEKRDDTLVFTSQAFNKNTDFIGKVSATLYVQSSSECTDFFVRISDVDPDGVSLNICDGLYRVTPENSVRQADGSLKITVDMWSTAYQLRAGHRLRMLIASGAHPRWARNTGSGEPHHTATTLIAQHQTIYHDAEHPSHVTLPVL